jgi:Ca-activated chloride channel family protein
MFRFAHTEHLWWLAAIGILILVFGYNLIWTNKMVKKLSSVKLRGLVLPQLSLRTKWTHFILFVLMWTFLILGIANPQIGSKLYESKREGIDLILAVDVSNSMLAEDIRPNRLERTRMGVEKLIDNLQGDRLGIVIFAGRAYVQLPLTTDYAAAKLFTNSLSTNSVNNQGTSIGAALEMSLESFDFSTKTSKAIIIVTDGEDHEEDAIKLAKEARDKGVTIYTIGMGSVQGAPIPVYRNGVQLGFKKDKDGNTIITKLNEAMLMDIADIGGGKFFRANNGNIGLRTILDEINKLETTEMESKIFSDYEDRFQYFLLAALLLLILEIIWPEKRMKFMDKFNLFGVKK